MKTITFPSYPAALTDNNWKSSMDSKDKNTGVGELLRKAEQTYKKIKADFYRAYSQYEATQSKPQAAFKDFDAKFDSEIAPLVSTLIDIRNKAAAIKNPQPKTKAAAAKIIAEAKDLGEAFGDDVFNTAHENIKEACAVFLAGKTTILRALATATASRTHAIQEIEDALRTSAAMERQTQTGFENMAELDRFDDEFDAFKKAMDDMLLKRHNEKPIRGDATESSAAKVAPYKQDGNEVATAASQYHGLFERLNPLSKKLTTLIKNIDTGRTAARHQLTKDTESIMVQFAALYKEFTKLDNARINPDVFDTIFELERNAAKTPADEKQRALINFGKRLGLESTGAPALGRTLKLAQTMLDDLAGREGVNPNELRASQQKMVALTATFRAYITALQRATAAYTRLNNR